MDYKISDDMKMIYDSYEYITELKDIPKTVYRINNWAFTNCEKLAIIDIPNVYEIGYSAFYGCHSLSIINIPNVIEIGYMAFHNCHHIININSKLTEEQLLSAFGSISQYKTYKQRNREYKLRKFEHEL